ncbi:response regulator [Mesorhizobium sp. B2-7-1]|uniref:response regulator n=1 Tax=Mesorhizobium sp. B2-7-1 TaxID=2589909 RepID=UPI00112D70EE|nr:response regulator [Mesorhizobium sp. B2-7-1]TPJ66007.1 response regulator [Mesorhizobium sp. B2-7-1]
MSEFQSGMEPIRRVLVVDDEPLIRMLVVDTLEELGLAAMEAGNAVEATTVLDSDQPVDLLVTDLNLPGGVNGHQLVHLARRTRKDLKVLLITGYAPAAEDVVDDRTFVVAKPFLTETLAAHVRHLLGLTAPE